MKYKLVLNGYGKLLTVGKVQKDIFDFWSAQEDRPAVGFHLFGDPEGYVDVNKGTRYNNPCTNPKDPMFLDHARTNASVVEIYSPWKEYIHFHIFDEHDRHVYSTDELDLDSVMSVNINTKTLAPGYYLKAWAFKKGNFFTTWFESDEPFDKDKLRFSNFTIDGEVFIKNIEYNKRILRNKEDLTATTGWDYEFIDTHLKD